MTQSVWVLCRAAFGKCLVLGVFRSSQDALRTLEHQGVIRLDELWPTVWTRRSFEIERGNYTYWLEHQEIVGDAVASSRRQPHDAPVIH